MAEPPFVVMITELVGNGNGEDLFQRHDHGPWTFYHDDVAAGKKSCIVTPCAEIYEGVTADDKVEFVVWPFTAVGLHSVDRIRLPLASRLQV